MLISNTKSYTINQNVKDILFIIFYTYHALCAMLGLSGGGEMGPEVSSSGDALMICVNISGFISILMLVVLLSSSFRDEGEAPLASSIAF